MRVPLSVGLAQLHVDRARDRLRLEFLRSARIHEHRGAIVLQDIGQAGKIGLDGVAERPPDRESELVTSNIGVAFFRKRLRGP
jgi:hypothetical protein